MPSFYALDLIRAAEGSLPDLRTLEAHALRGGAARVGWPAPVRPEQSIDETEHDLSILAQLFEKPTEESRGGARHLLETNPHLGRSLRAQGRRWLPMWRSVDGLVDPDPETLALLDSHRLGKRSYSPGALEQYAACPYRFLLHAIHGLRPRTTRARTEVLEPLTRRSIQREVQLRFLAETHVDEDKTDSLPLDDMIATLDRVLRDVSNRHEERLAPAIPRIWKRGVEALAQDLRGWLRDLNSSPTSAGLPVKWQVAFGAKVGRPVSILSGHKIHGSIDLVERDPDTGGLWTVHLRTGGTPPARMRSIGGGEVLTPLLEALALEATQSEPVSGGRSLDSTQRGAYQRQSVRLDEGSRKATDFALKTVDGAIESGFLPQAPRRGACSGCQYRLVCGPHEESRSALKDRTRLNPLTRLRRTD